MGGSEPCPHCGAVRGAAPERRGPLEALYQEVARIREIAERQEADRRPDPREVERESAQSDRQAADRETIARLTREVQMLRETVARLRGTTHRAAAARPAHHVRSPAA
jgi:hypothetical protein